jgi:hypothetical protein
MLSAPFRFNEHDHTYTDARGRVPHITGLLSVSGWTDEQWFTEESSERGREVHRVTAQYDLGAVSQQEVEDGDHPFKGYLLAYLAWERIVRPRWQHVEVGVVLRTLRFGGRPDRVGAVFGAKAVGEIKTGDPTKGHVIQTALQAILVAPEYNLKPESILRHAVYVRDNGRFKHEEHRNRADFSEARRILQRYAR